MLTGGSAGIHPPFDTAGVSSGAGSVHSARKKLTGIVSSDLESLVATQSQPWQSCSGESGEASQRATMPSTSASSDETDGVVCS